MKKRNGGEKEVFHPTVSMFNSCFLTEFSCFLKEYTFYESFGWFATKKFQTLVYCQITVQPFVQATEHWNFICKLSKTILSRYFLIIDFFITFFLLPKICILKCVCICNFWLFAAFSRYRFMLNFRYSILMEWIRIRLQKKDCLLLVFKLTTDIVL